MANLCKGASLPPMTVPFNLIDLLLFICLPSALRHLAPLPTIDNTTALHLAANAVNVSEVSVNNETTCVTLDWIMVRIHIQSISPCHIE